jgi:hypothetical protein
VILGFDSVTQAITSLLEIVGKNVCKTNKSFCRLAELLPKN